MILDNSNYNTLGRLGPVYPRPEYLPGDATKGNGQAPANPDPVKVEIQNQVKQAGKVNADPARLTLNLAQDLTKTVSEAIRNLPPQATNTGPHRLNPYWGLINRQYI
jgi:hypothetical protein